MTSENICQFIHQVDLGFNVEARSDFGNIYYFSITCRNSCFDVADDKSKYASFDDFISVAFIVILRHISGKLRQFCNKQDVFNHINI